MFHFHVCFRTDYGLVAPDSPYDFIFWLMFFVFVFSVLCDLLPYLLLDGSSLVFVGGIIGVFGGCRLYPLHLSRGEGRKSLPQ
jgi:hypothetical protein